MMNVRYVDDILLFGKALEELMEMLAILKEELIAAGLEMHETETKILSSMHLANTQFIDIGGMFIQVMQRDVSHKYLGRMLNLDPTLRVKVEFKHRLQAGWAKFHEHRRWLQNKVSRYFIG